MRKSLLSIVVLMFALASMTPAQADPTYMILEMDFDGESTQQALDLSLVADDVDPILLHIFLNAPRDPETAQILWVAQDEPVQWVRGADDNEFLFVEHAVLPEGSSIQYRYFLDKTTIEFSGFRHHKTSEDWGINLNYFKRLVPGEYRVEAILRVPNRPTQTLIQNVNIVANPADPIVDEPEPNPNPSPNPNPNPGADPTPGGGDAPALAGFTPLVKSPNTRIIYVSNSEGNDANDGRSQATAVKTLDRGSRLMRNGKPDWLLLKAGDTWNRESFDAFPDSGAGADEPMVVSTYGEGARPLIIPPHGAHGFNTRNDRINGLIVKGLHFYAATRDPGSPRFIDRSGEVDGIRIRIGGSDGKFIDGMVVEDCKVTHFDNNILVVDDWARTQGVGAAGRIQVVIRRNIIRFASGNDSHSVGIYIEGSHDSVIEENLIDHNGWAQTDGFDKRNKRSHNIYAQSFNGPIIVRHNIISRGGAHGLQLRAGGDILNNLFVRNAMAFYTEVSDSRANYNVILESDDINPDVPDDRRGMGINGWNMDRYEVIGNVVARRVGSRQVPGIEVSASRLIVKDNIIYKWFDGNDKTSIVAKSDRATVSGNLSADLFNGREPRYVDPSRSVGDFAGTVGFEPTLEAFLNAASNRPLGRWPDRFSPDTVCDYIRAGFELKN